jgi:peroxiredoxin
MKINNITNCFCLIITSFLVLSCQKDFENDDFTAYFGGEIINPTTKYVLFLKNNEVIDTLLLDEKNRFFKKFDSLHPGLYSFKHDPEYQYIYFDKNDSLMVRINSVEFDESLVFCGKGDEKNNFLIELYLKNIYDHKNGFEAYDLSAKNFIHYNDSSHQTRQTFFDSKKNDINWSEGFDKIAQASLMYHYYAKKEIYPMMHKLRTGNDIYNLLPKNFYAHRENVRFNDEDLMHYSSFVRYLSHMLSNVSFGQTMHKIDLDENEKAIEMAIVKLNIADTLFKVDYTRNNILDQIAFNYLLEDQNINHTERFLKRYRELSTNDNKKSEITKIVNSIQKLKNGASLPSITLIKHDGTKINSQELLNRKSVIFFWTENSEKHLSAIHKKVKKYKEEFPDYQFIAINIDTSHDDWRDHLKKYQCNSIQYLKMQDFELLKEKWVITKLHRTIILDEDGNIDNAFVNLFDAKFTHYLK